MNTGSAYPISSWTDDQFKRFEPISDALEAHGYRITSEPLEGMFDQWLDGLKRSLKAIILRAEFLRSTYGFRGLSKNFLDALHSDFPEPSWSVGVSP